jgi:AcrR family transcriptional regulator
MNEADPRVKRTRKLLVDAFFALLAEKGFQAISVQDIAERSTVNRATFYTHFEDKYALMDWVVRDTFREALARRMGAGASFSLANLHLLVVTVCEFLGQFHGHCMGGDRDLIRPSVEAKVQEELYTFLLGWLEQAAPAGGPLAVKRETAASLMSWAIFGAGEEWSRGTQQCSADEWARQVAAVLVGGVSRVVTVPSEGQPAPPVPSGERAAPVRAGT